MPNKTLFGETEDISVFRILFWNPVWFYNPRSKLPKTKIDKNRILDIADTVGDHFTYIILPMFSTGKYDQSVNRNIVRKRTSRDNDSFIVSDILYPSKFRFKTRDGRLLVGNTILEKNKNIPEKSDSSIKS